MGRKRVQIALAVLVLALIATVIWQALSLREPRYQGRPLSAWLQSLNDPPGSGPSGSPDLKGLYGGWNSGWTREKGEAVRVALSQMGTRVTPALRSMIRFRETPLRQKLIALAERQRLVRFHFKSESEIHLEAAAGCALAERAVKSPLVEDWIRLLEDQEELVAKDPARKAKSTDDLYETSFCFYRATGNLGPEACGPLLRALATGGTQMRRCAAGALRQFPSQGEVVVPALLARLREDPDGGVRYNSALALGHMQTESKVIVPVLLAEVTNSGSRIRAVSVMALSCFTNEASSIIPVLTSALEHEDSSLQGAITNALKQLASKPGSLVPN